MTDAIANAKAIQAELSTVCQDIAAALSQPASTERTGQIAGLWQKMETLKDGFAAVLPAIHPKNRNPDDPPDDDAALEVRLDLMRHGDARLRLWPRVAQMLERQAAHRGPHPLVTEKHQYEPGRDTDLTSYMMTLLHRLANAASNDRSAGLEGQHRDIGLSGAYFINLMQAAFRIAMAQGREGKLKFLDMGCGGGTKVLTAAAFFDEAHGIEYNDTYVTNAQETLKLVKAQGCTITQGDAMTFDGYGDFDVVYFHRPISDKALLAEMETRIVDQAKPGTILIAPYPFIMETDLAPRLQRIWGKIYLPGLSAEEVADLRERAMDVGPDHPLNDPLEAQIQGFFAPIIAASRRNGYGLAPRAAASDQPDFD